MVCLRGYARYMSVDHRDPKCLVVTYYERDEPTIRVFGGWPRQPIEKSVESPDATVAYMCIDCKADYEHRMNAMTKSDKKRYLWWDDDAGEIVESEPER